MWPHNGVWHLVKHCRSNGLRSAVPDWPRRPRQETHLSALTGRRSAWRGLSKNEGSLRMRRSISGRVSGERGHVCNMHGWCKNVRLIAMWHGRRMDGTDLSASLFICLKLYCLCKGNPANLNVVYKKTQRRAGPREKKTEHVRITGNVLFWTLIPVISMQPPGRLKEENGILNIRSARVVGECALRQRVSHSLC